MSLLRIYLTAVLLLGSNVIAQAQIAIPDATRPGAIRPGQTVQNSLLSETLVAQAEIAIPDATRPGAIRPEQTGRNRMPPVAPASEDLFERPDAVLDVPPVIDRPFEIDDGPKVAVKEFRIPGAVDLPDFDITMAELSDILQQEVNAKPEGFTVGQLQEAADLVTIYYREKGLILAQAVVPVQTVDTGVVIIEVAEGRLGRVLVEGNDRYSEALLTSPFKNLIGKPVTQASIESALLQLTDFPGLSVFGVFQPGQQVGTADMVLRVQDEQTFDVAYRVDNHGLNQTGKYRFRPSIEWHNPTGGADRISLSIQQTYVPKNNTFTSAEYDRYLGWGIRGGFGWTRNLFDVSGVSADGVDLTVQQIVGENRQHSAFFEKSWLRSRQMNFSTRLGYAFKNSTTKTRGIQTNNDKLSVFSFTGTFDNVDTRLKGINFATLEYSRGIPKLFGAMGGFASADSLAFGEKPSRQGLRRGNELYSASGGFDKVFLTANRLQTIKSDIGLSILARGELQWTADILVPLEQYPVGGPDNVRAYPPAQQLLDRAAFYSFELIKTLPFFGDYAAFGNRTWGELVQLSLFYDFAVGRLNNPRSGDVQDGLSGYVNFSGAGAQMRFNLPGLIESRIMFASDLSNVEPDNGRANQIWGDFTYRF